MEFHRRHERLKKFVHEGMRYPLPPAGQKIMGFVYFSIPVIASYFIYNWTQRKALESIGEHGENIPSHKEGSMTGPDVSKRFGGVHLVENDPMTAQRNQEKIKRFLRKQKLAMDKAGKVENDS